MTLLVGRQKEHLAHKKLSDEVLAWLVVCLEQGANDLHMVKLVPLSPHYLCFSKIQNGLSFQYRSTGYSISSYCTFCIHHFNDVTVLKFILSLNFSQSKQNVA